MDKDEAQVLVSAYPDLKMGPKKRIFTPTSDPAIATDQDGHPCIDIKAVILDDDLNRKDFGDLHQLADSIKRVGLLHPIGVRRAGDKYHLVYGGRRLRAFVISGERYIPFTTAPEDPVLSAIAEQEENLRRKDVTWPERCSGMEKIHRLYMGIYGASAQGTSPDGWNQEKTATLLGVERTQVSDALSMAKKMRKDPSIAKELGHLPFSAAVREQAKKEKVLEFQTQLTNGTATLASEIHNLSCLDDGALKKLPDQSIDLWVTDPPYGRTSINKEHGKESSKSTSSMVFADLIKPSDNMDSEALKGLLSAVISVMTRKLKPGAHCYLFFTFENYSWLVETLTKEGFLVDLDPLIWFKGAPMTPAMGYSYPPSYEPILFAHFKERTRRLNGDGQKNVFSVPTIPIKDRLHPFQKPQKLLLDLITRSSGKGDLVVDTFAGSGSTILAARELDRRSLGWEIDPENYKRALLNLGQAPVKSGNSTPEK